MMIRINREGIIELNALADIGQILEVIDAGDSGSRIQNFDCHLFPEEIDRRRLLAHAEKTYNEKQEYLTIHHFHT
jgi:hypothetical protein